MWLGGNGAWSNDVQWSLSVAPSSTDSVLITNTASSYIVTIDSATPSSELTNYNLTIGVDNGTVTTQRLNVISAAATWRVNDRITIARPRGELSIADSAVSVGTNVRVAGTLLMTNVNLVITSPTGGSLPSDVGIGGANALVSVQGGSITATNAANSAGILVGSGGLGNGNFFATNTLLLVSSFYVGAGQAVIANAGLAVTNLLRSVNVDPLSSADASLTLAGGIFDGTATRVSIGLNGGAGIASLTNSGAVWNMNSTDMSIGNAGGRQGFFVLNGGTNRNTGGSGTGEYRVGSKANATGTLTVVTGFLYANGNGIGGNGALSIGSVAGSVGTFNQYGGRVVITNSFPNAAVYVGVNGKAFWNQTNGTLLADRFQIGANDQQFIVGKNALIEIKQADGFSNTAPLSISNNFAFDGTLKFTPPTATSTQLLMLAGLDLGGSSKGYTNNFSLGTLDLSGYGSANRLQLIAPNSMMSTALYVGAISQIATNDLISSYNVYYLPDSNPELFAGGDQGKYMLNGGGFLIPIPEPSGLLLFALAFLGGLVLRKRKNA
jgi:hypothetical protein